MVRISYKDHDTTALDHTLMEYIKSIMYRDNYSPERQHFSRHWIHNSRNGGKSLPTFTCSNFLFFQFPISKLFKGTSVT